PAVPPAGTSTGGCGGGGADGGETSGGGGTPPPPGSGGGGGQDTGGAPPILQNGGFEEGQGGCGPGWLGDRATLTRSTTAHSGTYSCEVCLKPGTGDVLFNLFPVPDTIVQGPKEGDTYYAIHGTADADAGALGCYLVDDVLVVKQ